MTRTYTAIQDGKVVRHGTFTDVALLRRDFPAAEYQLLLDQLIFPDPVEPGYAEQRRKAYPPEGELADAIYWQSLGDNTKMEAYLAKVSAVKAAIPKV